MATPKEIDPNEQLNETIRNINARQEIYRQEWEEMKKDDPFIADDIGLEPEIKAKLKFRQEAHGRYYLGKHLPTILIEKFGQRDLNRFKAAVEEWVKLLDENVPPVDPEILNRGI